MTAFHGSSEAIVRVSSIKKREGEAQKREEKKRGEKERQQKHSNSLCLLTQGQVLGLWLCVAVAILGDCLSPVLVWSLPPLLSKIFWSGMGSDGFQTQRRGLWIPGKERAERVLADAISILMVGRSESNVWMRWCCRRCHTNIPVGLRGEVQAGCRSEDRRTVNGLLDGAKSLEAEKKGSFGPHWSIVKSRTQERKWHGGRVEKDGR